MSVVASATDTVTATATTIATVVPDMNRMGTAIIDYLYRNCTHRHRHNHRRHQHQYITVSIFIVTTITTTHTDIPFPSLPLQSVLLLQPTILTNRRRPLSSSTPITTTVISPSPFPPPQLFAFIVFITTLAKTTIAILNTVSTG
jgi:hypothetical protein